MLTGADFRSPRSTITKLRKECGWNRLTTILRAAWADGCLVVLQGVHSGKAALRRFMLGMPLPPDGSTLVQKRS